MLIHHTLQQNNLQTLCMIQKVYLIFTLIVEACMQINKKILLDNLEFVFHVIALTETWINEDNANIFSLDGYNFCHKNRINKKR